MKKIFIIMLVAVVVALSFAMYMLNERKTTPPKNTQSAKETTSSSSATASFDSNDNLDSALKDIDSLNK